MREGLVPTPRSRWHRRTVLGLLAGGLLALLPLDLTPWDLPPPARADDVALTLRAGAEAGIWESEPTPTAPLTVTGLTWQGEAPEAAWVRTSADGGTTWGEWAPVGLGEDHGPDPGSIEASGTGPGGVSDPVWVGEQDTTQWRVQAPATGEFGARLVDTTTRGMSLADRIGLVWRSLTATAPDADAAPPEFPGAHSRAEWGGDACGPVEPTDYSRVQMMFVHHTATAGSYSAAQVPSLIYGMCAFHTEGNGWNDIAYNVIIDEYGGIWEGRGGGLHLPVQPAATMGFNYVSNAVGLLGTYTGSPPTAAQQEALVRFLDWKLGVHHIDDPAATVHVVSAGSTKFAAGTEVSLDVISGHRDAGETTCPGDACYSLLGTWRGRVNPIFFPFTPHFDDDDLSPFELEINILYEVGLSAGCTPDGLKFCPLADVSRGAMAVFLTRALNLPIPVPGSLPDPFDDDNANALEPFINAIASAGITAGCGVRTFCPDGDVTRGEMAVFLTRALGLEPDPLATDLFGDDDATFYEPFVNVFALAGITAGCGNGNYCGDDDLPREQMAVFLLRGFVESGIYPPDPGCETTTTTAAPSTSLDTSTSSSSGSTSSSSGSSSSSSSMGTSSSSSSSSSSTTTTEPPSSTAEETSSSAGSTTTTLVC